MDRRSLIKHAGVAGVLAAGVAPAVHAQAAIRWRLASSFPKPLDTIYGGAEVFAKKVSDMTAGKFQLSVHAGGELMPPFGVVDGVQQGSVEMGHTVPYYYFGKNEAFAIGAAIPFGMNSRQQKAHCALPDDAEGLLRMAMTELHLSARAYDRILKVARTIADLASSDRILADHIAEAIQFRSLDREVWG